MVIPKFGWALSLAMLLLTVAVSVQASEDQVAKDLQSLSHKDAKIRGQAAWVLGKSGDIQAVGPLIQAMEDEDRNVRQWAVLALRRLGGMASQGLIGALESGNESVRWQAAAALGQINDSSVVEPLIMALFNRSNETRYWAAISLGQIGDVQATEPLVYVLGNENQSVRVASGLALLAIEGAQAVDRLVALLKDSESGRRVGAAEALGRAGDARAVQPLLQALRDSSPDVRAAAAGALGAFNDSQAIEPLISALADYNGVVRSKAVNALAEMGRPATGALIAALERDDIQIKQGAAEALGEIKDARAVEPLIVAFTSQSREMRLASVAALLKINKSSVVEPFIQILMDKNATGDLQADAAWALGEMGDARATEVLLQALASSGYGDVRMNAARALKRIEISDAS